MDDWHTREGSSEHEPATAHTDTADAPTTGASDQAQATRATSDRPSRVTYLAVPILVLVSIIAMAIGGGLALRAERGRTHQISVVGDLRATADGYVQQLLLAAEGQPADPAGEAAGMTDTIVAFLEGGEVQRLHGSIHNGLVVDAVTHPAVRDLLLEQQRLAEDLIVAGELLAQTSTDDPAWPERVQDVRTDSALFRSVVGDTVASMQANSESALDVQLWLLVLLSGVVLVGGSVSVLQARLAGRQQQALLHEALVHHAVDWVAILDEDGRITYSTPAAAVIFGEDAQLVGMRVEDLLHGEDDVARFDEAFDASLAAAPRPGSAREALRQDLATTVELEVIGHHGLRRLSVQLSDLRSTAGIGGVVLNAHDLTEQASLRSELEVMAYRDPMTGLANRVLLLEHLDHSLAILRRDGRGPVLVYLDLDDFKNVNDAHGHDVGDLLLATVAQRLDATTRDTDVVARLGGDEFALLLANGTTLDEALAIVDRASAAIAEPIPLRAGITVRTSASFGIRAAVAGDVVATNLLRDADIAMYAAKAKDPGSSQVFHAEMHNAAVRRRELAKDLAVAISEEQLWLAVQPKVSAEDESIQGVEALLRWDHPVRGPISPAEFIPVAEETGLIHELGLWVLRRGAQLVSELSVRPGLEHLTVAVNVSARELSAPDFVQDAVDVLEDVGVDPSRIVMEITETVLTADPALATRRLRDLRDCGIAISIDDFGTGYSSLSRLRTFPISELKVDRSFVQDAAGDDSRGKAVLRTITALGRELGLDVVAEGVETERELAVVRAAGVDRIQGYWFGRPVSAEALLATWDRSMAVPTEMLIDLETADDLSAEPR